MTTPRRRVIRPSQPAPTVTSRRLSTLRTRLDEEQQALARWMSRLKRAFHSFEKYQQKVARIEKQIRTLEET